MVPVGEKPPIDRSYLWVALIVGVAIVLRAGVAIAHPFWFPDSADYYALAKAITHGLPYQVNWLYATRMPGYPVFVAAVYALCGPTVKAVLIIQALMGGTITWLVFSIGSRVSEPLGLLAAILAAIDPISIGFSAAFLSETPFTLLMLIALWLLLKLSERGGGRREIWEWALLGTVWGAAVYMRASALWLILPLMLWTVYCQCKTPATLPTPRLKWRGPLLAFILVGVSLLPWQWRNYQHFHERMFRLTTLEGMSLYEAVYPGADGSPKQTTILVPESMTELNESQRDDHWSEDAWNFIVSDPVRIAGLAVVKVGRTWSPWLNAADFQSTTLQTGMVLWHVPLFIFALIGMFTAAIPFKIRVLLAIPILYFTAVHALFLGSVRYRVPLMPLICLFAAAGISAVIENVIRCGWMRRTRRL